MVEYVFTDKAPKPVGPYSQAVKAGPWLFISGQIPIDPSTGEVIRGDVAKAARRVLDNVKAIVEAAGGSLNSIVKVTVYLRSMDMFNEFNKVYSEYFSDHRPARAIAESPNLPKGVDLEVDAIAYIE